MLPTVKANFYDISMKIRPKIVCCQKQKMAENLTSNCSISSWYKKFKKNCLETEILTIPEEVLKYLEHDAFILPVEASDNHISNSSEWSDGSPVDTNSSEGEFQPAFPEFSKKIQEIIDDFGAVFLKTNWRAPLDATWMTPTKTLKCTSLDEVYLLLKSSNRILDDLSRLQSFDESIPACLVLKKWREINPCTEFRCFVVNNELIGISQRDIFQYHQHIELEKYNIKKDITSLFLERIKHRFPLGSYIFDVTRYGKDKIKIIDFGCLDKSSTANTLFTYDELQDSIVEPPEFRFIAEEMGIQPNSRNNFCVPQEINELFRSTGNSSVIDMIREEVENQRIE